jgi:hypothetical protein
MGVLVTLAVVVVAAALLAVLGYRLLVSGALTVDTGWGRRIRPLGPQTVPIDAPRDTVYDLLAQPYLGRATRALQDKVHVLERGTDMVLAAHRESPHTTRLEYGGELGSDGWTLGAWWGRLVARTWEATVAGTLEAVKVEAERRAASRRPPC